MGNSGSPQSVIDIPADDLEIVGFNGAPRVECGRDLPVARWRSRNAFLALSSNPNPVYYTEKEIEDLCDQERVTLLPEAKPVPTSVIDEGKLVAVPVVLWLRDEFANEFKLVRPAAFQSVKINWQQLNYKDAPFWSACVSNETAESLLDIWGRLLIGKAESARYSGNWEVMHRLADLGLCAASDRALRYQLYLLYAAAQVRVDRESAKRTFDFLVCHEFPEKTWEEFEHFTVALDRDSTFTEVIQLPKPTSKNESFGLLESECEESRILVYGGGMTFEPSQRVHSKDLPRDVNCAPRRFVTTNETF